MPATKKIGLIPNFVVDARNIFFNLIAMSCGFDETVPLIPITRLFSIGSVREGEKGTGASFNDTVDDFIETRKIILTIAFINLIIIKEVVNSYKLGS